MAKKQANTAPIIVTTAQAAAAKPATIPVKAIATTRHARAPLATKVAVKVATPEIASIPAKAQPISAIPVANSHEAISKIAYRYFVGRGYRDGNAADDWFRAEREFYSR